MKNFALFIMLTGVLFGGCARKEDVVAYIGGRKITVRDFEKRIKNLPDYYLGFMATQGGKRQYLSGMIREEVLLQKAKDINLDKRPEVSSRLEDARRDVLLASVIAYLQDEKI